MTCRWQQVRLLIMVVALSGCVQARADDESCATRSRSGFATSSFVTDFSRDADELTFSAPDGAGGSTSWRVRIDTSLVEPIEFDEAMPYQGRITSEWKANGRSSSTWVP